MDTDEIIQKILELPGLQRVQKAYAECTELAAADSADFRATVLRWLDDEQLHDEAGKSLLVMAKGDANSTLLHWAAMKGDHDVGKPAVQAR